MSARGECKWPTCGLNFYFIHHVTHTIVIYIYVSVLVLPMVELKHMSRVVRKPYFCICENKDEDQLRGNREADQRLCFRYLDSTIPLLSKYEISSL